jgi:hypothetical protein
VARGRKIGRPRAQRPSVDGLARLAERGGLPPSVDEGRPAKGAALAYAEGKEEAASQVPSGRARCVTLVQYVLNVVVEENLDGVGARTFLTRSAVLFCLVPRAP